MPGEFVARRSVHRGHSARESEQRQWLKLHADLLAAGGKLVFVRQLR